MGLFGGLEKLGFGSVDLKEEGLFKAEEHVNIAKAEKAAKKQEPVNEEEYLFEKKWECPVCKNRFTEHTVRAGRTRRIGSDADLRPRYNAIDPLKYDVVFCKKCGYAAIASSFPSVSVLQRKLLNEEVVANFKGVEEEGQILSYEEAILRFKLALYCAVVKHARNSEKAYLCLKLAWLYRGNAELLDNMEEKDEAKIIECRKNEQEYIAQAQAGFEVAMANEMFPICGMDESTFNYLMAELYHRLGKIEQCKRLIGVILVSKVATNAVKDRARLLKDELAEEAKANAEGGKG